MHYFLFQRSNNGLSGSVVILAAAALAISSAAFNAATYYVSSAHGNDAADGSSSAPWKTISRAKSIARDGDTVILRCGSYGNFTDSSVHSKFITYQSDTNAVAVFQDISVKSSAYLRFDGIIVNGSVNAHSAAHFELLNSRVAFKGSRYSAPANLVDIRYTRNALIKGCTITNGRTAIKIDNAASPTISGNNIYNMAVDGMTATPVTNLLVEYNHVHDLNQDRIICKDSWTTPNFTSPTSAVTVQNLKTALNISVQSDFSTGILAYVNFAAPVSLANITVTGITLKPTMNYAAGDLAIRVSTAGDGNTSGKYIDIPVRACTANTINKAYMTKLPATYNTNTMTAVRSAALVRKANRGPGTITITEWTFSNGAHQDFLVISGSNIIIRNNVFHYGASQGIFTSPADAANVTIENNLMYDLGGTNLTNLSLRGDCIIRNNTFVGKLRPGYENQLTSSSHYNGQVGIIALDSGAGFKICNNIVVGELSPVGAYNAYNIVHRQTKPGLHTLILSGATGGGYSFDRNFFAAVNFSHAHNQLLDYKLAPNSPAINFGITACQPETSLGSLDQNGFVLANGPARDASRHSVGAREVSEPLQKQ